MTAITTIRIETDYHNYESLFNEMFSDALVKSNKHNFMGSVAGKFGPDSLLMPYNCDVYTIEFKFADSKTALLFALRWQ